MVLTRNSVNAQQSPEVGQKVERLVKEVGKVSESEGHARRSSSRLRYEVGSDIENDPSSMSGSSRRLPDRSSFGRYRQPRGVSSSIASSRVSIEEASTVTHLHPPESKRVKLEEAEQNSQDTDVSLGRTRLQTRRINDIFSSAAIETCDEEDNATLSENENEKPSYNLRAERRAPQFFQPSSSVKRKTPIQVPHYYSMTLSNRCQNSSKKVHRKKKKSRSYRSDSSSSDSSDDERRFLRKKNRSMLQSRRSLLPMNFTVSDMTQTQKDRKAIGSSLADVDPMSIDKTVTFESIGGMNKHIRSLKEMILLPFLYPELFAKFNINPPRGCLFYGPPGTGKTLMARALANECSKSGRKIAFFMRKGADCLSKWVGESERQLRLLFDQAYVMRPSILFFDEIDGLAPVRNSRQDQIHSSIVSTLLALMDGLDSRGEIIVIGATNRLDAIDPALRRPGRFDREFLFKLPDTKARQDIVKIVTKNWSPPLPEETMQLVSSKTHGYSGADINLLLMEAALISARRTFPQIYISAQKLVIDTSSVNVEPIDIFNAMRSIKVSTTRAADCPGRPLDNNLQDLLGPEVERLLNLIRQYFLPVGCPEKSVASKPGKPTSDVQEIVDDLILPRNHSMLSFSEFSNYLPPSRTSFTCLVDKCRKLSDPSLPNLILPAILDQLEGTQVFMITLEGLLTASPASAEEQASSILREASRTNPSIICIPDVHNLLENISDSLRAVIESWLLKIHFSSSTHLVLLTISKHQFDEYFDDDKPLLGVLPHKYAKHEFRYPNHDSLKAYFDQIFRRLGSKQNLALLPSVYADLKTFKKVTIDKSKDSCPPLNANEIGRIREKHFAIMRELRIYLRDVLNRLARQTEHRPFLRPVDREEVNDYYEVIKKPMDLTTMMTKTDSGQYVSIKQFLNDIDLIADNALEYNPISDPQSLKVRHRACAFRDFALSMVKNEIDSEFEDQCDQSLKSFNSLGLKPQAEAPKFFFTQNEKDQKHSNHVVKEIKMKLRNRPGILCSPLRNSPAATAKVAAVKKGETVNRSAELSKGIIEKYRKQRQQKQAMKLGRSNKVGSLVSPKETPKASPIKEPSGGKSSEVGETGKGTTDNGQGMDCAADPGAQDTTAPSTDDSFCVEVPTCTIDNMNVCLTFKETSNTSTDVLINDVVMRNEMLLQEDSRQEEPDVNDTDTMLMSPETAVANASFHSAENRTPEKRVANTTESGFTSPELCLEQPAELLASAAGNSSPSVPKDLKVKNDSLLEKVVYHAERSSLCDIIKLHAKLRECVHRNRELLSESGLMETMYEELEFIIEKWAASV